MDTRDYYGTPAPRRGIAAPLVLALVAFVLGIAGTVAAVRNWDLVSGWVAAAPPAAPAPVVVAAKPAPVIVQPAPLADPALAERVNELQARLGAVEANAEAVTGDAERAEGLLVAFAARRALDRGQQLGYLEGMLRERFGAGDAASVAQIIAASQRPVTLLDLREGLAALRPTLVAASPDESLWTGLRREMSSLFVVRHADQPSQAAPDRYGRAAAALEQGQVDAAAAEVSRMPGARAAAAWLAQARRYVLARNALDRLETAALLAPRAPRPTGG
ncbi:hypothetical protein [Sphingomonas sp.]|uniref:hypothetical protein n=1 Tax=Sphingomonas sp. TaxID=28214 RepID=UPI003B3A64E3